MTGNNLTLIDPPTEPTMKRKSKKKLKNKMRPGMKNRKLRNKSNHRRPQLRNKRKRQSLNKLQPLPNNNLIGHKIGVIVASRLAGHEVRKLHLLIHASSPRKLPRLSHNPLILLCELLPLLRMPKRPKPKRKRRMRRSRRQLLTSLWISKIWSHLRKKNKMTTELQLPQ